MLALDLDGTILLPNGTATDRVVAAVRACADAGLLVCIATGRNYTESRPTIDRLGISSESVFVGGAMVIDTSTHKTLHRTAMDPRIAADVCGVFESLGHAALALQDTSATGLDYLISGNIPVRDASRRWMASMEMGIRYIPQMSRHDHLHTLRVGICCESSECDAIIDQLQRHFANRTMMHRLRVPGASCEVIEVFDPAVSKWEGINFVIRRHGLEPRHVIAVGDDMNDMQMIRHSGLGVAMGNSRPDLKIAADRVIGDNTEDGLAVFLENLLEGKEVAA